MIMVVIFKVTLVRKFDNAFRWSVVVPLLENRSSIILFQVYSGRGGDRGV